MPWRVALQRHILHMVLGVVVLVTLGVLTPSYLPWILPVVTGLILSIPIDLSRTERPLRIGPPM